MDYIQRRLALIAFLIIGAIIAYAFYGISIAITNGILASVLTFAFGAYFLMYKWENSKGE